MYRLNSSQLDNPAWYALGEKHQAFAMGNERARFYNPDYCPFGAIDGQGDIAKDLEHYATITNGFFIIGNMPKVPDTLVMDRKMICLQMIASKPIETTYTNEIVPLQMEHSEALFNLVNLVQPGYFCKKTILLGDYFGIFQGNELVAAAGERMKTNSFTEVSAIVNHPEHAGKGYATQLTAHITNRIFEQDITPILHVRDINTHAIRLYEKLGYRVRKEIPFWHFATLQQG